MPFIFDWKSLCWCQKRLCPYPNIQISSQGNHRQKELKHLERHHERRKPHRIQTSRKPRSQTRYLPKNDHLQNPQIRKTHPYHKELRIKSTRKTLHRIPCLWLERSLRRLKFHYSNHFRTQSRCWSDLLSFEFGQVKRNGHKAQNVVAWSRSRKNCFGTYKFRKKKRRLGMSSELPLGCQLDANSRKSSIRPKHVRHPSRLQTLAHINAKYKVPSSSSPKQY